MILTRMEEFKISLNQQAAWRERSSNQETEEPSGSVRQQ